MIDAQRRSERVIGTEAGPLVQGLAEELWEVYATDTMDPTSTPETAVVERP